MVLFEAKMLVGMLTGHGERAAPGPKFFMFSFISVYLDCFWVLPTLDSEHCHGKLSQVLCLHVCFGIRVIFCFHDGEKKRLVRLLVRFDCSVHLVV